MEEYKDYLPQSIEGKTILITGGTTGIGRAAAVLLAKLGARVMVFGRYEKELQDALKDIRKEAQHEVYGFTADLALEENINRVFEEADKEFEKLDVLINNAAIGYGSVTDGTYKDWEFVVKTNLVGYMACTHEAVKRMKVQGEGHIINIGSLSAERREEGSSVYVATKSGIRGLSASLRKQVNPLGVKVSLIEPGAVDTDMQKKSTEEKQEKVQSLEMLTANDIAMSILYTLSQPKRCDIIELKIRPHLQKI